MNEVFLIGKIVTDIKFDFIINSKNCSIATFGLKTLNKQIIQIKAFDRMAEYSYSKLELGDIIFIYGRLGKEGVTVIKINIFS